MRQFPNGFVTCPVDQVARAARVDRALVRRRKSLCRDWNMLRSLVLIYEVAKQ